MQIEFDPSELIGALTELQRVQIPGASVKALNRAAYDSTRQLSDEASRAFQSPVPFTLRSFKYQKATIDSLEAKVFIRDDAPGGNAPANYLLPQIAGGPQYPTRFQGALLNTVVELSGGRSAQVLQRGKVMVPNFRSPKTRRNQYGNMSSGQFTQILTALRGNVSSADLYTGKYKTNNQKQSQYIYLDEEEINEPYFRRRLTNSPKPGIYFVNRNISGGRYYRVMTDSRIPRFNSKFKFNNIGIESFTESFIKNFKLSILK